MYPPTAASLPFLFELAADGATPDRAAVVALMVSIGREALERGFEDDGAEIGYYPPTGCTQAVAFLRERGGEFAEFARDSDPDVRLAAIGGLGLFLAGADRRSHQAMTEIMVSSRCTYALDTRGRPRVRRA
ncbi:hypothetical protein [Streptomyces sp. NPDC002491]